MNSLISVFLVLLATGLFVLAMIVAAMARMLLCPPRMTDGKASYLLRRLSPGDLGLVFETVRFDVRDLRTGKKLRLAGWWIPAASDGGRCVVIAHGYADAKVGGIAWAPLFHQLGYHILAVDLRAHGESDGVYCTGGFFERHDLDQAINQIRVQRPDQTRHLVLFGVSLGAAVALATAAMRDDVAAVILESPFAGFSSAARTHARLLGMPRLFVQTAALKLAEWISGADFSATRPVDLLSQVDCPLMLIQSADDPFVTEADKAALETAAESRTESCGPTVTWRVDGAEHVLGLAAEPQQYQQKIAGFLEAAMAGACSAR